MRKRGRKPAHAHPLDDARAAAAMRVLNEAASEARWTEAQACAVIARFGLSSVMHDADERDMNKAQFQIDITTFRKVAQVDLSLNDFHKWAIYFWARSAFPQKLEAKQQEEQLQRREKPLHALNTLLGFEDLDIDSVKALSGSYDLYRPLYKDPGQILVQRLIVGHGGNVFDCTLSDQYEPAPGVMAEAMFRGKIVPQGERAMAVLRFSKRFKGYVVIHFDDLDLVGAGGQVQSMGGLMISAIGGSRSSAWPLFAKRVNPASKIARPVLSEEDRRSLDPAVTAAMLRGAVHWDPSHYARRAPDHL